jgi:hypothetical protein
MDDFQKETIEQFDKAVYYLDKLFEHIPSISHFEVANVIHMANMHEADNYSDKINFLLLDKFKYADEVNGRYWITLNEKGIAAKRADSHTKYEKLLAKRERAKRIADWPKNNWWVIAIFTWLAGMFTPTLKDMLKITQEEKTQVQSQLPEEYNSTKQEKDSAALRK